VILTMKTLIALAAIVLTVAIPAHAHAAVTGTEYIQEMSTSPTSPVSQVVAYGAFTATGTDTQVGRAPDHFQFPGGTFVATWKPSSVHNHLDPGTCVSTVVIDVVYKLGQGTGQFAGITGSGHATTTIVSLAARTASGACSQTDDTAQQTLIEASGPVAFK
jgi:hypothetical protein